MRTDFIIWARSTSSK